MGIRSQLLSAPWPVTRKFPTDYSCQTVRCRGASIALVAMHLRPSIGLVAGHMVRVRRCGAMLAQLGIVALVFADWGSEPDQLLATGWPRKLDLVAVSLGIPACVGGR